MKRLLNLKILVLFIIICCGTYALSKSLCLTIGIAILMLVLDNIIGAWADKKDKEYFYKDEENGETD